MFNLENNRLKNYPIGMAIVLKMLWSGPVSLFAYPLQGELNQKSKVAVISTFYYALVQNNA